MEADSKEPSSKTHAGPIPFPFLCHDYRPAMGLSRRLAAERAARLRKPEVAWLHRQDHLQRQARRNPRAVPAVLLQVEAVNADMFSLRRGNSSRRKM